jgi:biotin carboxyl carrier protein
MTTECLGLVLLPLLLFNACDSPDETLDTYLTHTANLGTFRELEVGRAESEKKEAELNLERFLLEAKMKTARASLAMAELLQPRLEYVTETTRRLKALEMRKTRLNIEKLEKQLAGLVDIQKEERTHLELKIRQSQNKIDKARESLDKLELKAPVGGMVLHEISWSTGSKIKEGDPVWGMMPLAKIPDMRSMQVKLQVGETDTQFLEQGQPAEVVIPALGDQVFTGVVKSVAKRAQPVQRGSKVKRVEVVVSLDSAATALVPGLSARSTILTSESSGVMVVPLDSIFEEDSLNVVYVRRDRDFLGLPVTIEERNTDHAVITAGELEPGAVLALSRPSDQFIAGNAEQTP